MKTLPSTLIKSKPYFQAVSAIFLSLTLLIACKKTPEPETTNETATDVAVQTTPVTSNINVPNVTDDINANASAVNPEQDVNLTELEDNLGTTDTSVIDPAPAQAITGAQITDVKYRSASGESLSVVFETSAAGMLNAIITLPNKPKMTLSAPEGQGNNPTYRSSDGNVQLISHAGGGTVDFIQNNKMTSFDAISADAELITE
ncbi:hypothetical protein FQ082_03755 [Psychrobacter sp. ANT_H56B]|uniref:hypothetical protein n=1 Tax=Psychrobacter sp. ANT_H56B TaxID=2597353 RepID=UPI0011F0DA1A|nr:hypothetical protein [Psychrobacter sp. ANT_H56B]KAA0928807.1 hypothetical protein FQ082_03755 [Psychrobacter sp. ANT_H56B]